MGRPSLKDERREQIMQAFERCVARYGLEGATLERVAEDADLARALIRHNVGNRDDLIDELVERFLSRSVASIDEMIAALPADNRLETMVHWLFDPDYADPQNVLISEALIAASGDDPRLARKMRKWVRDFAKALARLLASEKPKARAERVSAVAAGLTGIYFNVESLSPLGKMSDLTAASQSAALILLEGLDG